MAMASPSLEGQGTFFDNCRIFIRLPESAQFFWLNPLRKDNAKLASANWLGKVINREISQVNIFLTLMYQGKKVIVVLPAYNAALTLEKTYDEIPLDIVDEV